MGKKTGNKDKNPRSDVPGGHALFRLRQMELERGLPRSDDEARAEPKKEEEDDEDKKGK